MVPRPSTTTYIDKVLRPSACLYMVLQASDYLYTVPRPSSMIRLDKVPLVTRPTACLDTIPRPNANTCLGKMP